MCLLGWIVAFGESWWWSCVKMCGTSASPISRAFIFCSLKRSSKGKTRSNRIANFENTGNSIQIEFTAQYWLMYRWIKCLPFDRKMGRFDEFEIATWLEIKMSRSMKRFAWESSLINCICRAKTEIEKYLLLLLLCWCFNCIVWFRLYEWIVIEDGWHYHNSQRKRLNE